MKTLVWYWLQASMNCISYQEVSDVISYKQGFYPEHTVLIEWIK